MAGHPDLHVAAEHVARRTRIAIPLPEMHAVGAEPLGEPHAIVDDERHAPVRAEPPERRAELCDAVLVHAFQP